MVNLCRPLLYPGKLLVCLQGVCDPNDCRPVVFSFANEAGHRHYVGHAFAFCVRTFGLHEISVLFELTLGHLRYLLTDLLPQPNSPPDYVYVFGSNKPLKRP
jgi:hypothetical protein